MEELKAIIALKMCDGIGDVTAHKIISHLGSAANAFEEKSKHLSGISGLPANITQLLTTSIDWKRVNEEYQYIEKHAINYAVINHSSYPQSLLQTNSPPVILFYKGDISALNFSPCISIVGTRSCTPYGQAAVEDIIKHFKKAGVSVISGLALGIDITAHKVCLEHKIKTFGIVGHGLKTIYPAIHTGYAAEITEGNGAIVTEFFSSEIPNRENFPKRNRIIAGLSKATIVIEASPKSGTLITADLALNYGRQVFALPGRYTDKSSAGCNFLLKNKRVKPVISINQLMDDLGLKKIVSTEKKQLPEMSSEEKMVFNLIYSKTNVSIDNIASETKMQVNICSAIVFNLEMLGLIRSLPGKTYGVA